MHNMYVKFIMPHVLQLGHRIFMD